MKYFLEKQSVEFNILSLIYQHFNSKISNKIFDLILGDPTIWHNINEARRVFGRAPVDKFLTRYLSCGIDTIKIQDININNIWQTFKKAVIGKNSIFFT